MKQKLSISVDSRTVDKIEFYVKEGVFRNKSHAIEYALNKLMKEETK